MACSSLYPSIPILYIPISPPWYVIGQKSSSINANTVSLQGKAKKTRKFATVKRLLNPNDTRLSVESFSMKRFPELA